MEEESEDSDRDFEFAKIELKMNYFSPISPSSSTGFNPKNEFSPEALQERLKKKKSQ
jgi:hypothetical protein